MNHDEALAAIAATHAQAGAQAMTPALIAKTGAGKTTLVHEYARRAGFERVETLLLGSMLDVDVLGLPRADAKTNTTIWTLPETFRRACAAKTLVFLDEFDKARPDTKATVLTLLTDRAVRGVPLHPETRIIAAMQPVDAKLWAADETLAALIARVVFLPLEYDWAHVERKHGVSLAFMPPTAGVEIPRLPQPAPRQIDWALAFARAHADDDALTTRTLDGLMAANVRDALLKALTEATPLAAQDVIAALIADPARIAKLEHADLSTLLLEAFKHPEGAPVFFAILERVLLAGPPETVYALYNPFREDLIKLSKNAPEANYFGDMTEDQFIDTLDETLGRVGAELLRRNK